MAYAAGPHTVAGSAAGGNITTTGIDTSGMSLILLNVVSSAVMIITDSKGNTATALTPMTSDPYTRLYYYANPTVGAAHTFTASAGVTQYPSICVASFSGSAVSSQFDVQNGAQSGSASSQQPGSVTPSENSELVISGFGWGAANSGLVSVNGSFTITDQVDHDGANHYGAGLAYLIQTTAASANPTWTRTGNSGVSAVIATFKAAVVAGGGLRRQTNLNGLGSVFFVDPLGG